jgi:hypothetical protein
MKDLQKIATLSCWLLLCFLYISASESKAQVKKMSANDLTKESTAVLYGKCSKLKSEWNENRSIIYTQVTIIPEEYIKGNLGSEALITIPGGKVDNIVYEVSEMPVFIEGEEVVAFIWTNPAGKHLITGGYQGRMKIEKDKETGKRMVYGHGISEDAESQEKVPPGQVKKAEKMQLEDFVVKLKGYLKN